MKRIEDQGAHAVLALGDHDDRARQDFAFTFRNYVTSELMPSNRIIYDKRAAESFARTHGHAPATSRDVRAAMKQDEYFSFYASARRSSQELIWGSVTPAVEKNLAALIETAARSEGAGGHLTLDPDLKMPSYAEMIDIHCMPGGYTSDYAPDDVAVGAIYDRGVYLYMSGLLGPLNDGVGKLAAHYIKARFPDFKPKRILDMGCGVGHATLPYCDLYPDAEVVGIDVGPALLRYAHARAESLGKRADFVQANAEQTPFEDGSFDLVVSNIFLHETSTQALPRILAESRRLLGDGGLMAHIDQPRFLGLDPYQSFMQENETYYNNEPFWIAYRKLDLEALAVDAGFAADKVGSDMLTAAVVQQSQNNEKVAEQSTEAKKRGFQMLMARK
jgi:SAM-dependent methyltransferase